MADENANKPPVLRSGQVNDPDWVFYLQQLLNFAYEQQVVTEDGNWGPHTANAVEHYRRHYNLGGDDTVDKETWKKLGYTETASATEVKDIQREAPLIGAPTPDLCWAAAIATVLGATGPHMTVQQVCQTAGTGEVKQGFSEVKQQLAQDKFHLTAVTVDVSAPTSWTAALESHGPILTRTGDEYVMVVVSGIRKNPADASKVDLHILHPVLNNQGWVEFHEDFIKEYHLEGVTEEELFAGP